MTEAQTAADTVAGMVTGPGTPDAATITKPARAAVGILVAALTLGCGFGALIIGILAWWVVWPDSVAPLRIHFLGWIGIMAMVCIPMATLAAVSPYIAKVSASAGVGSVSFEARD